MQFTTMVALLVATVGIHAAPNQMSKRLDTIPLGIYTGGGCNDPPFPTKPVFVANVPTDGSCFPIAPVSGNTDSGRIDNLPALPAVVAWSDTTCSSVNFITFTRTHECSTLGAPKFIRSARAVGTCK
ncbi:uncharacterized protein K460DRAFT_275537 [Cucurbitaria berberidis CBS 394.84]|uniref:Uncharacterized protein n=1 Tax=Cucurbitaria berberidis CBS 394.84 TaxID=1168544 RepID=A0A9P4L9G5_9PLEO|nr:uncharacterized protein K460DRAFT_275537 [Cucurbitaria berberidis CBS 394.84]KAF1847161.1 hypothetical protein K460DRAFT_275537 [Cucurbitaria berberidis CBS 394.84]